MNLYGLKGFGRLGIALPVLLAMLWGTPAAAFQFNLGEVEGSLDTTLSYGLSWRVADRDKDLIGLQEGGRAYSHNFDDGNLNYDQGDLISNTTKITSELALNYNNFGLFLRGTAFYDFENMDNDRARTKLRDEAIDLVGKDADLLDAYLWWNFELGDMPGQIRVGDQVLNWGESTFIQNGISVINPFDVSKLRVPGAELKEALVPVGMVSASISPTENLTIEGFYQYEWDQVIIDPPGSYWSTNDFVGDGGDKVMLGFGDVPDNGNASPADTLLGVPRAADIYADDNGQYGIAMRLYAPGLNDTEFGFYFMNYHSRLPLISSWTGSPTGLNDAGVVKGVVAPSIVTEYLTSGGTATLSQMVVEGITQGTIAGGNVTQIQAGAIAQTILELAQVPGIDMTRALTDPTYPYFESFAGAVSAATTDAYAKTARYQVEYPEDIKLFGVSFNTVLPATGVALQGEISHRQDAPFQIDDLELLLATLEPLAIANAGMAFDTYSQYDHEIFPTEILMNGAPIYIQGYEELDVTQVQTTATKLFGPTVGADQFTLVGEVGMTYVHDMPSKSKLRFDGPGTPVTGNEDHADPNWPAPFPNRLAAHPNKEEEPSSVFADEMSWGYRLVGKLDFNNAIGAVTLSPRIAWAHDVSGTTPGPGGNFVEDRKAITFGLGALYQNSWSADLSYTNFFGAGRYNLINDRDFIAFNVKYSF